LIALWKLNPANNEPIIPLDDYPRKKYHSYEQTNGDEVFISAEFEIDSTTAIGLSKNICPLTVRLNRNYFKSN
jgi:hypothetical protein